MADPLKDIYSRDFIKILACSLSRHFRSFPRYAFVDEVFDRNWRNRSLKERMYHIADCLHRSLPDDYEHTLKILKKVAPDFDSFAGMLFPTYVELYGCDKKLWNQSMAALEEFTKSSSSEFAIRRFLLLDQKRTLKQMHIWAKSRNEHVRRLASEGLRPRLPWAMRLDAFLADPAPILPILKCLRKDPSDYVRRSVANNINDISKDHPALCYKIAQDWGLSNDATIWILKHGMRTLLKEGEKRALNLFGFKSSGIDAKLIKCDRNTSIGSKVNFKFQITTEKAMKLRIEYAIHFLRKNGTHLRKVFKISEKNVPRGVFTQERNHDFKAITTRNYYPGEHELSLIINGNEFERRSFRLVTQ